MSQRLGQIVSWFGFSDPGYYGSAKKRLSDMNSNSVRHESRIDRGRMFESPEVTSGSQTTRTK